MSPEECFAQCASLLPVWFEKNKRQLPWREDPSPYHVWVSEIMLQQTRVEAVKGYYARFLQALPDIPALAEAPEQLLLKLWEGLGYYNRVRNLQKGARQICREYGGEMPASYEELLNLSGIGEYTAGAIASMAFGKAVAAVDGNVLRVSARLLADDTDIGSPALKKQRKAQLEVCMPQDRPGVFNQAWMDLGATVCLPNGEPKCEECPLREICRAYLEGKCTEFPKKAPKAKRKLLDRTVFVIRYKDRVLIRRRPGKGLLAGMYELPAAEGHLNRKEALAFAEELGFLPIQIEVLPASKHIFSHLEWRMQAYLIRADELVREAAPGEEYRLETPRDIGEKYPIPSAFAAYEKYLKL